MRDFKMKGKQYLHFYFITKWNQINPLKNFRNVKLTKQF